ncbi:hypothetical protein [Streptomyces sp. Ag109_G2-15]|uniref:hypothetical protein n=1 Tax=Streptomyces sp. Ag109_G2-15 TaxID=1938850 RepID=UPI000C6FE4D1|nr:hypothetical protein [Streptomyces sp. Ag109_G2-15]
MVLGVGRFLACRDLAGAKRTDAILWRPGSRVLPEVEGRVPRGSYRAKWPRLAFRLALGTMGSEGGYLFGRNPDSTAQTAQNPWENRDATLAVLETNGIGSASASAVRQPHGTRRIRDNSWYKEATPVLDLDGRQQPVSSSLLDESAVRVGADGLG